MTGARSVVTAPAPKTGRNLKMIRLLDRRTSRFLTAVGLLVLGAAGRCDWPMFRHDAARSGRAEGAAPGLKQILWSVDLGGPVDSSPAVAQGVVVVGTAGGALCARDAATGAEKWTWTIGKPIVSSPCIDEGRVFFGCVDGYVYALGLETGEQLWKARTGRSVVAPPLTVGDRVICGSTDGRLYAFSKLDGNLVWETEAGGEIHAGAAANAAVVVYGDWDRKVRCVRVEDGSAVWPSPYVAEGPIIAAPVIEGAFAVVSSIAATAIQPPQSLNVHCLDLATGKRVWGQFKKNPWQTDKEHQMSVSTSSIVVGEQAWFMTMEGYGNWSAVIRSANLKTGARGAAIKRHAGGAVAISDSSPALAESMLYFAGYAGFVYAIDATTGRSPQALPLGAKTASSPAISDGRLYIGLSDGKLLCIQ